RVVGSAGAQQAGLDSSGASPAALVEKARRAPGMEGQDLASKVSCAAPFEWTAPSEGLQRPAPAHRVTVVDFGVKRGILRQLVDAGCAVEVVPWRTSPEEILGTHPAGVVLSNCPGDPPAVAAADGRAAPL